LKPLMEGAAVDAVVERLFDEQAYTVCRLPIDAMRTVDDPIYDQVIALAKKVPAENPDTILFGGVANGDGEKIIGYTERSSFRRRCWVGRRKFMVSSSI